ncbi:MAG: hypothetical protein N3G80_00050 [Candidatus Micrarchaeota archaeon]|nr:hypothetical protein [Candidatus Micrarchaeota archaeon]
MQQKTNAQLREARNGVVPAYVVIYWQCKTLLEGRLTSFKVGNYGWFDEKRARQYVAGVESEGEDYVSRNYPALLGERLSGKSPSSLFGYPLLEKVK